jgi:hypothetical protein
LRKYLSGSFDNLVFSLCFLFDDVSQFNAFLRLTSQLIY